MTWGSQAPQESSSANLTSSFVSPEKMVQLLLRIESLRCITFGVLVFMLSFIIITLSSRVTSFALRRVYFLQITSPILVPTLSLGLDFQ